MAFNRVLASTSRLNGKSTSHMTTTLPFRLGTRRAQMSLLVPTQRYCHAQPTSSLDTDDFSVMSNRVRCAVLGVALKNRVERLRRQQQDINDETLVKWSLATAEDFILFLQKHVKLLTPLADISSLPEYAKNSNSSLVFDAYMPGTILEDEGRKEEIFRFMKKVAKDCGIQEETPLLELGHTAFGRS